MQGLRQRQTHHNPELLRNKVGRQLSALLVIDVIDGFFLFQAIAGPSSEANPPWGRSRRTTDWRKRKAEAEAAAVGAALTEKSGQVRFHVLSLTLTIFPFREAGLFGKTIPAVVADWWWPWIRDTASLVGWDIALWIILCQRMNGWKSRGRNRLNYQSDWQLLNILIYCMVATCLMYFNHFSFPTTCGENSVLRN